MSPFQEMEEIHDSFYAGLYAKVLADTKDIKKLDEFTEFMVLRSRIFCGQIDFVINQVKAQSSDMHKGVYLLAQSKKCNNVTEISNLLPKDDETTVATSPYYAICKAMLLIQTENISEALIILSGHKNDEAIAEKIHCLLLLNRPDIAQKELENISSQILRNIWTALVSLYLEKEEVRKSLYSLQDIADRLPLSPLLANAIACCYSALGEWDMAQMTIQNAAENFPNDESVIINQAVALHRGNDYEKLKTQVQMVMSLNNDYTKNINEMLKDFDDTVARL